MRRHYSIHLLFVATLGMVQPVASGDTVDGSGGEPEGERGSLTVELVDIDPLGAELPVPWTVHSNPILNIRAEPTVNSADIGNLSTGTEVEGDYYLVNQSDEEWLLFDCQQAQACWCSVSGLTRPHPTNIENIDAFGNLPYGREIVNRWWGLPSDYEPDDLVTLPTNYTGGRSGLQLREEVAQQAFELIDALRADGLDMEIASPYRSWSRQKTIYDGNTQGNLSQRFSAPPGHSEHQLGATMDFSLPGRGRFLRDGDPQHDWLIDNGADFGFRQTYTPDNTDETGYVNEPWHWRYVGLNQTETGYSGIRLE